MIETLLGSLNSAFEGGYRLAVGAAFVWGVMSVLLSPCHLGSIPLIVGFIGGQANLSTKRAFALSGLFALGILVTIGLIGALTALLGRMLGDIGDWGKYLVAGVFALAGLYLLDLLPEIPQAALNIRLKSKGLIASLLLGLVYGLALGPCSFAFMAPILAVAFSASGNHQFKGVIMLGAYGIGHALVIMVAGGATELAQRILNWGELSRGTLWLRRTCGALAIGFAAYLVIWT